MPRHKIRFVTLCQQLLALGVVLAVLTPAASVVNLDIVRDRPQTHAPAAHLSAYARELGRSSVVPVTPVDPTVTEYALTPAAGASTRARTAARANVLQSQPAREVTSVPQPVVGYGAVGVTWQPGVRVPEQNISVQVRTRTGSTWSGWMDLVYDADHGPDAGSEEAAHARPGTDALLVGDVDDVQVRATAEKGALPADLKLAVVDPGQATKTTVEGPALETAPTDPAAPAGTVETDETDQPEADEDAAVLQAATYTPRPTIYSRAQWGADEKMRDKSSLHYFEVHAGFVHHTVNANGYTREEVPGIIRSIYAYHTKSRGWSDIGYNFLVDRFGRIWEGRYGGIDRPVVGAHTLNYNDYAFAMSAIGNFDTKKPTSAMVEAYGALFAWKLSLHGVDAASTSQQVGRKKFQAINGHRDAASTACPGKYLYEQIPKIRQLASKAQRGWAGRELESNLASNSHPDIVARRASDGQLFVIPTGGLSNFGAASTKATGLPAGSAVVSPDLTGDGIADLLVRQSTGEAQIRPGTKSGTFADARPRVLNGFAGHDLVTAVGDVNGDRRNDLVGRLTETGRLDVFLGRGNGTFGFKRLGTGWDVFNALAGVGDLSGDGKADMLARDTDGGLWLYPGTGASRFGTRKQISAGWNRFSSITGFGDLNGDRRSDVLVRDRNTKNLYIYLGRGNGTLGPARGPITSTAKAGELVGAAQVVGSAHPDAVFRSGSTIRVAANAGRTETRAPIATGLVLKSAKGLLNAGDWDRDGRGDLLTRESNGDLNLRRGDGKGHFAAPVKLSSGFATATLLAAVGDMTGDGWPDLMAQPKGGVVRIYPGAGMKGLRASYPAHGTINAGRQIAVGRWDGDGAPDSLFLKSAKPSLYSGNGPGGLTSGRSLSLDLARYDWVIGISDIDLTGHADLVVREKATGYLWLIPGTPTGFGTRRLLAEGMGGYNLAG